MAKNVNKHSSSSSREAPKKRQHTNQKFVKRKKAAAKGLTSVERGDGAAQVTEQSKEVLVLFGEEGRGSSFFGQTGLRLSTGLGRRTHHQSATTDTTTRRDGAVSNEQQQGKKEQATVQRQQLQT